MPSRRDQPTVVLLAAALAIALTVPAAAQPEPGLPGDRAGLAEITRARDQVKSDPNLAITRTIKALHWRSAAAKPSPGNFAWLRWIADLFRWLDQSVRVLVWVAAAILAGMLVVYLTRTLRRRRRRHADETSFVAPTHVQELDIRPESLPEHVGAAARLLWDRGEHRPALALLYRALLSRLAHVHRLPIRASTTEGDCLALAAGHLPQDPQEYVSRLIQVWQHFVYGGQAAPTATVYVLCDAFAPSLDAVPAHHTLESGDPA